MCGLLADGSKASGFKSMVLAQFTGIGLQKDDRAFVKYNSTTGSFDDSTTVDNIHTDSRAIHRNEWKNFHINATNDASCRWFLCSRGYAEHFVLCDNGGDYSITNSTRTLVLLHSSLEDLRAHHFLEMMLVILHMLSHQRRYQHTNFTRIS